MAGEGREKGVYHMAAEDIFKLRAEQYPELMISASFFEIYGGQVYDLLNNRARLLVQEDGKQQVCITGLTEFSMESVEEVLSMITEGNNVRQTGATSVRGMFGAALWMGSRVTSRAVLFFQRVPSFR